MECSLVIPAYNEALRLSATLKRIDAYCRKQHWRYELIVVDDGSTDETAAIAARWGGRIRLARLPRNCGKGAAVRHGFFQSRYPWVLFSDADLSTPIEEIEQFLPHLGSADVLIGSRDLAQSSVEVRQSFLKETLGKAGNLLIQLFLLPGIHDTQCGFKLFARDRCMPIFNAQRIMRFGFDFELLYLARKIGLRIQEIPVRWRNDTRTKVRWTSYPRTLSELIAIRWNDFRHRYPL